MSHDPLDPQPAKDAKPSAVRRRARVLPDRGVLIVEFVIVGLCIALELTGRLWDRAIANLLIGGLLGIAIVIPIIWFAIASGFSLPVRMIPAASFFLLVALTFACVEIEGVDGTLVPRFRWRWLPPRDEALLDDLPAEGEVIQLDDTTDKNRFPQFLGPRRNATIDGVTLATNWQSQPPQLLWKQDIGAGISAFVAQDGYAFTMEQRGGKELVTCYEIATGELKWWHAIDARYEHKLGGTGPRSTPTLHQGKIYAMGATGVLRCLDMTNGELVWQKNLLSEFNVPLDKDGERMPWGRAGSPLVVDDLVIVPAGGPPSGPYVSLVAYDKDTGDEVWRGGTTHISCASPTVATIRGQRQVIIVNENNITGHRLDGDTDDGQVLWTYPWEGQNESAPSCSQAIALPGDRVFVSKHYGGGAALFQINRDDDGNYREPETIWSDKRVMKTKFTNVAIKDGYVYGLSDGYLECIELETGQRRWKPRTEYGHGQILLVDDVLLVQCEQGEVALVDAVPQEHRELARLPALEGQTWNNPCLYGDHLLVRNSEQAACYVLPIRDGGEKVPVRPVDSGDNSSIWFLLTLGVMMTGLAAAIVAQSLANRRTPM